MTGVGSGQASHSGGFPIPCSATCSSNGENDPALRGALLRRGEPTPLDHPGLQPSPDLLPCREAAQKTGQVLVLNAFAITFGDRCPAAENH